MADGSVWEDPVNSVNIALRRSLLPRLPPRLTQRAHELRGHGAWRRVIRLERDQAND